MRAHTQTSNPPFALLGLQRISPTNIPFLILSLYIYYTSPSTQSLLKVLLHYSGRDLLHAGYSLSLPLPPQFLFFSFSAALSASVRMMTRLGSRCVFYVRDCWNLLHVFSPPAGTYHRVASTRVSFFTPKFKKGRRNKCCFSC